MSQDLSDEYVADLMKKESQSSSSRYSTLGLQAYLPKRSDGNAPKPNTRFLKSLLRDTTQHNAALLAREQQEARDRQRRLRQRQDGRLSPPSSTKSRGRVGEAKLRRDGGRATESQGDERLGGQHFQASPRRDHRSNRRRSRRDSDDEEHDRDSKRFRRKRYSSRSRQRSPHRDSIRDNEWRRRHDQHYRRRSISRDRRRLRDHKRRRSHSSSSDASSVPADEYPHDRRRRTERSSPSLCLSKTEPAPPSQTARRDTAYDSDPLEDIIGPAPPPASPPVKRRGRGFNSRSAMDEHFDREYDPSGDVQPDSDTQEDWDQAVEALRDRQKWQRQQADRLRDAGFSEAQIQTWERGGVKDESDVRWSKKGEGREWDRGKVVDSSGEQVLETDWGRLKGS